MLVLLPLTELVYILYFVRRHPVTAVIKILQCERLVIARAEWGIVFEKRRNYAVLLQFAMGAFAICNGCFCYCATLLSSSSSSSFRGYTRSFVILPLCLLLFSDR